VGVNKMTGRRVFGQVASFRIMKTLCPVFLMMIFVGCGYRMVGKETHLPPGISSIAIPTFKNRTHEPGIEIPFTKAFLKELIQDRRIRVVSREEGDAVLEGVVKSYEFYSVSYDQFGLVLEYRAIAVVDLTLRKRGGEVIWKENDLTETRTFRVSSSPAITESNKNIALAEIGRLMAGRVRNRFFYNF